MRDNFIIPNLEWVVIEALKQSGNNLTYSVKKSALLRAGSKVLEALSDATILSAIDKVPAFKTGRPAWVK